MQAEYLTNYSPLGEHSLLRKCACVVSPLYVTCAVKPYLQLEKNFEILCKEVSVFPFVEEPHFLNCSPADS